jgi:hypothetical protein
MIRRFEGNEIGIGHAWHQKSTTSPIISIRSVYSGLRGVAVIDVDPWLVTPPPVCTKNSDSDVVLMQSTEESM